MGQEYKISSLGFRKFLMADRNMTIYSEKKFGLSIKNRKEVQKVMGHVHVKHVIFLLSWIF